LGLGFVSAQLQGSWEPAPSPTANDRRQPMIGTTHPNSKIFAPHGYGISSNALKDAFLSACAKSNINLIYHVINNH